MSTADLYRRVITKQGHEPLKGATAVILAAGRGRRLSPLTETRPKPLLPVLNLPILLWKMARLKNAGIQKVCANVQYLPESFNEAVKICATLGPLLHLVTEDRLTGPLGGAISCRDKILDSEVCLIMSGDSLEDIDLQHLVEAHRASGAALTMTVMSVPDASHYGVLDIDESGFVTRMREKPSDVLSSEFVSCGIYVISTRLLARLTIPVNGIIDFVDQVSNMLSAGDPVFTHPISSWIDIGKAEDLLNGNLTYLNSAYLGSVASLGNTWSKGELWVQDMAIDLRGVQFEERVLLGSSVTVEPKAKLRNVVVGDGATIKTGAEVTNSLLMPGAVVSAHQHIDNQIVQYDD